MKARLNIAMRVIADHLRAIHLQLPMGNCLQILAQVML